MPIMAVGGINNENTGVSFLGIGSGVFKKEEIVNGDYEKLKASLEQFETEVLG